jgi:hypothetical protein
MRSTEREPSVRRQARSTAARHVTSSAAPFAYPRPTVRSRKSDMVVPAVLVVRMTVQ